MSIIWTDPGKLGDCIHRWAVPHWFHKDTGKSFEAWLDEHTLKSIVPLIEAQPGVTKVRLVPGVENWSCGGQPWHMNLKTDEIAGNEVYHLGFRSFPQRKISIQTRGDVPVHLKCSIDEFSQTPHLVVPEEPKVNRCLIHGMGVCTHNRQTPEVWKFLATVRNDLADRFDVIEFIGTDEDRAVGKEIYPEWGEFEDQGDLLKLAVHMNASRFVLGAGSSLVALAGALKVPSIRVHDAIQQIPKVIFSNLGDGQLNSTELELRKLWPGYAATYLSEESNVAH